MKNQPDIEVSTDHSQSSIASGVSLRAAGQILTATAALLIILLGPPSTFAQDVIWAGSPTSNAYTNPANWQGGSVPTSSDVALFTSAGATDDTSVTNVVISSNAALSGLRFSHGPDEDDSSYRVEIEPSVTVSVSGEAGFTMLRDSTTNLNVRMLVEMFGGGNLVVGNSAANWSLLGESSLANRLVLNMGGLKSFTADVDRVGLGSYEVYPNYTGEPDRWVPNVTLAETNFIRTAWIGGEALHTNTQLRPYAFTIEKNPEGAGHSSGQTHTFILGRTNVFFVESILFSGEGGKSSDNSVSFNSGTNVIPEDVVPVAYFRGPDGTSRVSVFAIGDNSGVGGSGQSSKGTVNLTGGKVDALVDVLYVGRDRLESTDNAVGQGDLSIGGDNAAGTTFDVNTAYISMQELGNNQSDPANDNDPSGEVYGTLNVGANALFKVNGTLHLGYTTADPNDKRAAETGNGAINISNGGTVMASNIFIGGITKVSANNRISINSGGQLIVSEEIGQADKYLNSLSMNAGILTLHVDGNKTTPYVYATNVVTSGGVSTINLAMIENVNTFPTQLPLIGYVSASPNFGVTMPVGYYGYIVNNTANSTIDVVILNTPPANRVWNGSPGTEWNTTAANWQGPATFANGDTAQFDDTAINTSVTLNDTVFVGGSGVLVSNDTKAYSFSGSGNIGGTSPLNKRGTGSLAINVSSELPLTVHEGTVTGSGAIGSTLVNSNGTLNFGGSVNRLVSSGTATIASSGTVANGAVINAGTFTVEGAVTGAVNVANSQMTVTQSGQIIKRVPSTSTIQAGASATLNGVWRNGIVGGANGTYRIDVFGTLKSGASGWIDTGNPNISHSTGGAPPYWSRLVINNGGVLSPGTAPGSIVVFTNESQLDFQTGSTIEIDVDMDSTPGSNPMGNSATGSATAKNSDVIFTSRWSTRTGTLKMNRVGNTPWTNGTVIKVLGKPFETFGGGFVNRPFDGTEAHLPVMDPPSPGLGLLWDVTDFATNGVIRIVGTGSTIPTLVTTPSMGTNLTFSWPASHIGWELLTQTRALTNGLSLARSNWTVVAGSRITNQITITNWLGDEDERVPGAQFYRLGHPPFE